MIRNSSQQTHMMINESQPREQNEFPLKKLRQHRNLKHNQNQNNIMIPLSARKHDTLKDSNTLNFLFNSNKKKIIETQKNNQNISIQQLNYKLQLLTERVSSNERQIQLIKINDKSQIKNLIYNFKDLRNIGQRSQLIAKQLESIKLKIFNVVTQLNNTPSKNQFDLKLETIQWKITDCTKFTNKSIQKLQTELINLVASAKSKLQATINYYLQDQNKKNKVQTDLKQYERSSQFAIHSIGFCHQQKIFKLEEGQTYHNNNQEINTQRLYYLDPQGFLLDQDKCYLIDEKNKLVRLNEKQLQMLRSINIIK